jgi:hypothetical protein
MKSTLLLFLLACLTSLPSLGQKEIKESISFTTPPVIDGQVEDWGVDWLMDAKTTFLYNVGNDNDNLYLRAKVSNETAQQKIALFGLTVYFIPEGGKRNKLGLRYPMAKDKEQMKREEAKAASGEKKWLDMKKDLIRDAELLELIGLADDPILSSRVGLMNGIEVIMVVDSFGDLVYEAKIPFKAYRIDKSKTMENFGVVFETGRLVIKQSMTTAAPTYYRGQRYRSPMSSQPYNEFTVATVLRGQFKLK